MDILPHGRSQLVILASEEHSLFSLLIPVNRARHLDSLLIPFRERLALLFENAALQQNFDAAPITLSNLNLYRG